MKGTPTKCKHRRTWIIGGGSHEWCYECGALRQMARVNPTDAVEVTAYSYWVRPTGEGGANPYEKMKPLPRWEGK